MSVEIKYNDAVIASLEAGQSATLQCNGKKMVGDVKVTATEVADSPLPIEISTAAEMTALLETAEVGSIYKYTGETTHNAESGALYLENGNLYMVVAETNGDKGVRKLLADDPMFTLRGVWRFNTTLDFSMFTTEYIEAVNGGTDGTYKHEYIFDKIKIYPKSDGSAWYVDIFIPQSPYNKYQKVYSGTGWMWSITTIDFGEEMQTVTPLFYEWITRNATKVS